MRRRDVLRATVAGLAGTALVGRAAANRDDWEYSLASTAPVPGATDSWVHDEWAYTANLEGLVTYDLSDPSAPQFGGHARGGSTTHDNRDVKVAEPDEGDLERIAGLADNGDPGGVTFYDVSDPSSPERLSFYNADSGVHNHDLDGDFAYLTLIESGEAAFSESRLGVVDIRDPENPEKVAEWYLKDLREDMAMAGTNPLHDVYVQDGYAYMSWWKAGVIVADVTDPTDPRAVAHFAAHPDATQPEPEGTVEFYSEYAGDPENAHTTKPSPDRAYTVVGTESFAEPTGEVLSEYHGGARLFYTPALTCSARKLSSIAPLAGEVDHEGHGMNPKTKKARADPFTSHRLALVRAPGKPQDAVRTSHNFSVRHDKLFTSWYQEGVRAWDYGTFRSDDPDEGKLVHLAFFDPPAGDLYWNALDLDVADAAGNDGLYYTVGSDTGDGLHVLELRRAGE
jgi:hypothetical protein